ncbi:hypothetical protein CAEBREN_07803 [Caenorhabditis brenneri]|uniref:Sdz-33 F-box domain-containing protein n=1 Tax=Caenorhabditis brenneri TaxID=135651 RepID=G0N0E0_CAEBE|nr:hypothetical protein CAEBREN_07803 [Caenorhabditis brenneri]
MNIDFYEESNLYWGIGAHGRKKKLTAPQTVNVYENGPKISDDTVATWENNTRTMQYWLKHLQDIFHYPKIDFIWFTADSSQFDIDDITEVFGSANQVWISDTGCYAFNQMILQNFLPVEKIIIKPANFQNAKIPGKILMQNFDFLDIDNGLEGPTSITLDELLLINSKKSYIGFFRISAKQINKFIKLWQRGSNSRMEYLGIDCTNVNEDDNEVIMEGISHQVIPADQRRRFKPAECGIPEVIEGGIDVSRRDGVKATILFRGRQFPAVEMVVWFDHCVMES